MANGGRFDINPGPLRIRGEIPKVDPDASRCEAFVRDGSGRCLRDGVRDVDGVFLCTQHALLAELDGGGPGMSELPDWGAQTDQMRKALSDMAVMAHHYFEELVGQGFTRGEALQLTIAWHAMVLNPDEGEDQS